MRSRFGVAVRGLHPAGPAERSMGSASEPSHRTESTSSISGADLIGNYLPLRNNFNGLMSTAMRKP